MRRIKIICTIGPACDSSKKVKQLLEAGMNVARLNFSHGTHAEHGLRMAILKKEAERSGKHLAILLDTQGPEVRTCKVPENGVALANGAEFILDTSPSLGSSKRVGINYKELWRDVFPGTNILIDDGKLKLEVIAVQKEEIRTIIRNGGVLKSQKGINVPGVMIRLPGVTAKDVEDIRFGITQGIDFIAASFTRKASDILAVRRIVEEMGALVQIIAKIESQEGIDNLDSILEVADGVMVARGDLGVEVPVEDVPVYQKEIIGKCNLYGKPVIVATQMLESMMWQPQPTRAEASDVANAILDGADAIMLSGETAAGQFPVETVSTMDKIARRAEKILTDMKRTRHPNLNVAESISFASYNIARDLCATAILTPTQSGLTARMISKYRPNSLVIAATPFPEVARKLALQWGVEPLVVPESSDTDQLISLATTAALNQDLIRSGDIVVITAGIPAGKIGTTNLIKVQVVGEILAKGMGIGRKSYTGTARIMKSPDHSFNEGDILVAKSTDAEYIPIIARAGALVVEEAGLTSHAAIVAIEYGIPAIIGLPDIDVKISEGQTITIDAFAGVVYAGFVNIT